MGEKAIIYLRVSTADQEPENQRKDCETLIKDSWQSPSVFLEKQSAYKDNKERPKFEDVRKQIKSGNIKHLVVWDLDRIYRNRKKLIEFFKFCKFYNTQVHSYRQQWLESINEIQEPFNEIMFDLMLQIMGWLAEEESRKKSDRVKAAYQKKGGKGWGRKREISQRVVNEVLEMRKAGHSYKEIAESVHFNDKSRNKKFLSKTAVHKILNEYAPKISS